VCRRAPERRRRTNAAATCTRDCPGCTHAGRSGADCSGCVTKLWQVPSSNDVLTPDEHPDSTGTFVNASPHTASSASHGIRHY
jgi:hypothetical protein